MQSFTLSNCVRAIIAAFLIVAGSATTQRLEAGMIININAGAGLAGNAQALTAFQAAANQWSSRISTDITVNINADLASLGPGIIGSTSATFLQGPYDLIRNQMAAHLSASPTLSFLASSLPTLTQINATLPSGFTLGSNIVLTQASAKALGFGPLPGTDAAITFSSDFAFAYTPDQLNGSTVDFQTVAAHEIGHALGFVSAVDIVDSSASGVVSLEPLDLFRFSSANLPTDLSHFTTNARSLVPGSNDFLSDINHNLQMSTGVTGGDGRQASHWKADELNSDFNIGIMDPTLANGVSTLVSENDLLALSLIGYTIVAVPEPGSMALIVVGLSLSIVGRRGRAAFLRQV